MAKSCRVWPGSFADRLTAPLPGMSEVWRMWRECGPAAANATAAAQLPVRALAELPPLESTARFAVTWVGHASFVVQLANHTILTDPVWSRRLPGVAPRLTPPGVRWEGLPPIDAVVISHNHFDHLDAATIRRLPRHTPVLVPGGLGRWFRRRGFTTVTELDWWESHQLGEVRFDLVPAHHWSRRKL